LIAVETENDIIVGNLKIFDDENETAKFLAEAGKMANGYVIFSLPTTEAKATRFEYPPVLANNAEHGLIIEYKGFAIDVLAMPRIADDTTYAERVMFLTRELPDTIAMCAPVPASQTAILNSRIRRSAFQLARPTRGRGRGKGPRRPQEDITRVVAASYAASQAGRAAVTEVRESGAFAKPNTVEIRTAASEPVAAKPLTGQPVTTGLPPETVRAIQGAMEKRGENMSVFLAESSGRSSQVKGIKTPEFNREIRSLIAVASCFYKKNWLLGTSGNLSALLSRNPLRFVITATGTDKGSLSPRSFVEVEPTFDRKSKETCANVPKPSGETLLHTTIYQHTAAGSVIHVHSPYSLAIAELFSAKSEFSFGGYEVQKGLGFKDISETCRIPILKNRDDLMLLSRDVAIRIQAHLVGFLIERHGLFVWGMTIADAKRHVELLHHVFEYELLKRGLRKE